MLIKTFKFLSKNHTVNTASFNESFDPKRYLPSVNGQDAKEAKELYKGYYKNNNISIYRYVNGKLTRLSSHVGDEDHISFPLSFSELGNRIVQRYIDVMIKKYEIPRSEWEDRIKVHILSTTDSNGDNYVVYVCAFCGLNYKAGLTTKEWIDAEIDESDISDDAVSIKYNVCGSINVIAPNDVIINNNNVNKIKIKIESRDRYSNLYETYIYEYDINNVDNKFFKLQTLSDYISGKNNLDTSTNVIVPRKGKLFCSIADEESLTTLRNLFNDNELLYSVKRINNISPDNQKYNIITSDEFHTNYLDLGLIKIFPTAGSTIFTGTLYVYPEDKILDETVSPLNDIIVYVRTFNIDEQTGYREYNPDEQDTQNPISYQVKSNEVFSFEINHAYPYIEFSFKDTAEWWNGNTKDRPIDSFYYIHELTKDETSVQTITQDVIMYNIVVSSYKLYISIPHATHAMLESNLIPCKLICYYHSDDEPLFEKTIVLSRKSETDDAPYIEIKQDIPINSRICIKTFDDNYTSKYYNVGFNEEYSVNDGIITKYNLTKGLTNDIELYPVTSYNIAIQKFYTGNSRISYIDIYNHEKIITVDNQRGSGSINNMITNGQGLNTLTTKEIFEFVPTDNIVSPMPGTPIFINTLDQNDRKDNGYDISRNDYKKTYKINGRSYVGHFVIDNNCDKVLSDLTYEDEIQNYYISFNNIINNDDDTGYVIDKNIRIFGIFSINSSVYGGSDGQGGTIAKINNKMKDDEDNLISSAEVSITNVIPPCIRDDTFNNFQTIVEKHLAKYTLYNIQYYINCVIQNTNIEEVRKFLETVTGKTITNTTITEGLIREYIGSEQFIIHIPYDKSLYLKYPHDKDEEYFENQPLNDPTSLLTFHFSEEDIIVSTKCYKSDVNNYQIDLKNVT